jgi:hypothetical protein
MGQVNMPSSSVHFYSQQSAREMAPYVDKKDQADFQEALAGGQDGEVELKDSWVKAATAAATRQKDAHAKTWKPFTNKERANWKPVLDQERAGIELSAKTARAGGEQRVGTLASKGHLLMTDQGVRTGPEASLGAVVSALSAAGIPATVDPEGNVVTSDKFRDKLAHLVLANPNETANGAYQPMLMVDQARADQAPPAPNASQDDLLRLQRTMQDQLAAAQGATAEVVKERAARERSVNNEVTHNR